MFKLSLVKSLAALALSVFFSGSASAWDVPDACAHGCGPVGGYEEPSYREDTRFPEYREREPEPAPPPPPAETTGSVERKSSLSRIQSEIVKVERQERLKNIPAAEIPHAGHETGASGTILFNIGEEDPVFFIDRKEGPIQTSGSAIALEDLRRAASIVTAIDQGSAAGMSDEDAKFLADQAGRAMNGESLRVKIPPAATVNLSQSQKNELITMLGRIDAASSQLVAVTNGRMELEAKLKARAKQLASENNKKDKDDDAEYQKLKKDYLAVVKKEESTRDTVIKERAEFKDTIVSFSIGKENIRKPREIEKRP